MTVLQSLGLGKISAGEMSVHTGLSERELRHQIRDLRLQGYAIISDDEGYKLSNDMQEIRRCCARLRAHATSELAIATAMERRSKLVYDAVQGELAL